MNDHSDAPYRRQPHAGFAALRFDAPIEAEFRSYYRARNLGFVRTAACLAMLLIGVSMIVDLDALGERAWLTVAVKLAMGTALLSLVLASHAGALSRCYRMLRLISAGALAVGTLILAAAAPVPRDTVPLAMLVTVVLYLMLGLRLAPALCIGVPYAAVLSWLALTATAETGRAFYDVLALVAAGVVAALTCYRLELTARSVFLERQIVSILGGSDIATGIPNRRYFNSHLQSVRRQALREGKALLVALIEVEGFDRYRERYGRQEGDRIMRRVAHAVAGSARRPLDLAARFSETEIALVLYAPDDRNAQALLRAVRERIALVDLPSAERRPPSVLVGAAWCAAGDAAECDVLLECADRALTEARELEGHGIAILPVADSVEPSQITRGPWRRATGDPDA